MSNAPTSRTTVLARGLASLLGIVLILVGLPLALIVLGGNPLPSQVPSLEEIGGALTRPDDGTLLIGIVTVTGWLVWASLTLSFLVEIPAAIRGVPAPRLPGLSWQQGRAAAMTGAVAAMLAVGTPAVAQADPGPVVRASATVPAAQPEPEPVQTVTVRAGETLWGIAERELGDGHRYPELVEASAHVVQPDGGRLRAGDTIRPGWQVVVPQTVVAGHAEGEAAQPSPAQADLEQQMSGAAPPRHDAGPSPVRAQPAADLRGGSEGSADAAPVAGTASTATTVGLGVIACAGALALVRSRRRRQRRTRPPGWRLVVPSTAASRALARLEAEGDEAAPRDLYAALADLARRCAPGALPSLRAARLSAETIEVYVVEEDLTVPHPWVPAGGGTWVLDRSGAPAGAGDGSSPWPCLVTLGQDDDGGHIFINLEQIGALQLAGSGPDVDAVLAAIAIDLATSAHDRPQVSLVGAGADLVEALGVPGVTYTPDVGEVLDRWEGSARSGSPHVLLVGTDLSAAEVQRLRALRSQAPAGALAVVSRSEGLSQWSLTVDASGGTLAGILDPTGMMVRPPLLARPDYMDLLELLRSTSHEPVPGPGWSQGARVDPLTLQTLPRKSLARPAGPADEETTSLAQFTNKNSRIRVLGRVEVTGTGPLPEDEALATELAALIALHPGSDLAGVAHLLGLPEHDVHGALRQTQQWMHPLTGGEAKGGALHLQLEDVSVDWQHLRMLVGTTLADADSPRVREALTLVTGQPFDATPEGRYSWAIADRWEICAAVADIAHELAQRCLRAGDPAGASWAARKGLLAEPLSEMLWRDEVHAAWQAGQRDKASSVLDEAESTLGDLSGLTPEAAALGEEPRPAPAGQATLAPQLPEGVRSR